MCVTLWRYSLPRLLCPLPEHYAKIERENRLLLEKMSGIMQGKHGLDNRNDTQKYTKSLNKPFRKAQLQKITAENQAILRRIQTREPTYNHLQWEEERRHNEQLIRNICEYPLPGDSMLMNASRASGMSQASQQFIRQGGDHGGYAGGEYDDEDDFSQLQQSQSHGQLRSMDPEYQVRRRRRGCRCRAAILVLLTTSPTTTTATTNFASFFFALFAFPPSGCRRRN